MKRKLIMINVLNYLFYICIMLVHMTLYKYIQMDGTLVISSIAFTSLFVILIMFRWLNQFPEYKSSIMTSIALNFVNIVVLSPLVFAYALLSP